jgi:hypothetical protein
MRTKSRRPAVSQHATEAVGNPAVIKNLQFEAALLHGIHQLAHRHSLGGRWTPLAGSKRKNSKQHKRDDYDSTFSIRNQKGTGEISTAPLLAKELVQDTTMKARQPRPR